MAASRGSWSAAAPTSQTIVKYFILETDEYKEPDHPNIFRSTKATSQLKLKDIRDKFVEWKASAIMKSL